MTLALRRIETDLIVPTDWTGGVLKAETLAAAGEALDILEFAQADAEQLLESARVQADEALKQRKEALEQQLWQVAAGYAQSLQTEWQRSLTELEGRVGQLLAQALRRMTEQVPAEDRLRACVQQLMKEAGAPDGGVLLVNAEAHAAVRAMADDLPWPVQSSADLPSGTVRLVAANGRWECALDTVIERLVEALGAPATDKEEKQHAA